MEYRGLADVEGDFVELPSQVMENWATEPEMLEQYALHYRTNDKIPESLVRKIRRSAQFNQGFEMTELLAAALSADKSRENVGEGLVWIDLSGQSCYYKWVTKQKSGPAAHRK